jgi:hypothetical protein
MSGLRTAIIYGLMPNSLGYCGPQEKKDRSALLEYLSGKGSRAKVLPTAKKFEGAYHYYRLIAQKNNIKDPFDERVVEAYWTGNRMLEKVSAPDLKKMVVENFASPGLLSAREAARRAELIPKNAKPHHSFHVLIFGTITGRIDLDNVILKDICRIGWGKVIKLDIQGLKSKVIVRYEPLVLKNKKIKLGKAIKKEISWDRKIVPKVKVGDWVSFHWGKLAEILTKEKVLNLKKYTQNTLKGL